MERRKQAALGIAKPYRFVSALICIIFELTMAGKLFLIPVTLGDTSCDRVLPPFNRSVIAGIRHFIVEDIRSARRFLKKSNPDILIDGLSFYTLNEHTSPQEYAGYLSAAEAGEDMGIISEAGCPAVADPGANIAAMAQTKGIEVVPLVGPSSILLALMASGFNGQKFTFNGYLPIEASERTKCLKTLEKRVWGEDTTQIFIEAPYRNLRMLDDIVRCCRPETRLCIAANITCEGELIRTRSIREWKECRPGINKIPAIFLLYK